MNDESPFKYCGIVAVVIFFVVFIPLGILESLSNNSQYSVAYYDSGYPISAEGYILDDNGYKDEKGTGSINLNRAVTDEMKKTYGFVSVSDSSSMSFIMMLCFGGLFLLVIIATKGWGLLLFPVTFMYCFIVTVALVACTSLIIDSIRWNLFY